MILVLDNYDSFVFNLARYFERLGCETRVIRNDAITIEEIRALRPQAIVISPGPCAPDQAGVSLEVVRQLHREIPILGVCLGHQAIAQALGGRVVRADEPIHGRTSPVMHEGRGLFADLPSPFEACRYHSLVVEASSLPTELLVTARTPDGVIMALEHRQHPLCGVQFHPEAILTEHGYALLANFLRRAGVSPLASTEAVVELASPASLNFALPSGPVTF